MRIKKSLSKIVNFDDKESRYIYRIVENSIRNRQAFGIEIERQDFEEGEVINLERDIAVSYTHLDVYKRQHQEYQILEVL